MKVKTRRGDSSLIGNAVSRLIPTVVLCLVIGACSEPVTTTTSTAGTAETQTTEAAVTTTEAAVTTTETAVTTTETSASTTATAVTPAQDVVGAPAAEPGLAGSMEAQIWSFFTGLSGPTGEAAWPARLERACGAPIWEAEASGTLAAELLVEDGGDPGGPSLLPDGISLLRDAEWALWFLTYPDGCRSSFPSYAGNVSMWHNMTGLRGPTSIEAWTDRLARACALEEADSEGWARLAAEFVVEDGGDPDAPAPFGLAGAVQPLQIMTRPPGACQTQS